ncbi:aldehyde dehydrogenase family protein [Nocardiopsis synnemataformans]|uniref:aldehyde dehydrogenase family protein n=1 Tax=Nocardiopsis synnemataformans TaxID=61305 RepID=UPI003EB9F20D
MIERKDVFVGGEWRVSQGEGSLEVINPVTEQVIATVPAGTAADVDAAAIAAHRALPAWSRTPPAVSSSSCASRGSSRGVRRSSPR